MIGANFLFDIIEKKRKLKPLFVDGKQVANPGSKRRREKRKKREKRRERRKGEEEKENEKEKEKIKMIFFLKFQKKKNWTQKWEQ